MTIAHFVQSVFHAEGRLSPLSPLRGCTLMGDGSRKEDTGKMVKLLLAASSQHGPRRPLPPCAVQI
jgi:hypothetical protein